MNHKAITKALADLSATLCHDGMAALRAILHELGYQPPQYEPGVYVAFNTADRGGWIKGHRTRYYTSLVTVDVEGRMESLSSTLADEGAEERAFRLETPFALAPYAPTIGLAMRRLMNNNEWELTEKEIADVTEAAK